MPQVHFTSHLRELAPDGPLRVTAATVGDALAAVFTQLPHVRGYVLDERGVLRKHVCVFADGQRLPRDATLNHAITPDSKLYVMQALSGG
jgi:molybdopterin synthase sulfur carrier subunit